MPPITAVRTSAAPLRSVALILVSMFCFALVDALAKSVALAYPANEVKLSELLTSRIGRPVDATDPSIGIAAPHASPPSRRARAR